MAFNFSAFKNLFTGGGGSSSLPTLDTPGTTPRVPIVIPGLNTSSFTAPIKPLDTSSFKGKPTVVDNYMANLKPNEYVQSLSKKLDVLSKIPPITLGKTITDTIPAGERAVQALSKPLRFVADITKSLSSGELVENVSKIPAVQEKIKSLAERTSGTGLVAAFKASDSDTTFEEAYNSLREFQKNDPSKLHQFLYQLGDSAPQTAFGVALNFIPVAGKPMSSLYWTALSANEQIQNRGAVTSVGNVAIDVLGDKMLGNSIESLFKQPAKTLLKTAARSFGVEGGTEVGQDLAKYANDYRNAKTDEEKKKVVDSAKEYFTSGQILMTLGVGGLSGAGVGTAAYTANQAIELYNSMTPGQRQAGFAKIPFMGSPKGLDINNPIDTINEIADIHLKEADNILADPSLTPEALAELGGEKAVVERARTNLSDGLDFIKQTDLAESIRQIPIDDKTTRASFRQQVADTISSYTPKVEVGVASRRNKEEDLPPKIQEDLIVLELKKEALSGNPINIEPKEVLSTRTVVKDGVKIQEQIKRKVNPISFMLNLREGGTVRELGDIKNPEVIKKVEDMMVATGFKDPKEFASAVESYIQQKRDIAKFELSIKEAIREHKSEVQIEELSRKMAEQNEKMFEFAKKYPKLAQLITTMTKEQETGAIKGYKLGVVVGRQEAREVIISQLKEKTNKQSSIRQQITEYIKQNIPVAERGKFLNMVKDAKTQLDLTKAFIRIDRKAEQIAIKDAITTLKYTMSKMSDSNSIAADYRTKIKDIMDEYELSGHSQATMDKLKATQDYINNQVAIGEEVELPQSIINKLRILSRTPKDKLTLDKVQSLQSEIELLAKLGETKWASKQARYDAEKEARKTELLSSVSPIKSKIARQLGIERDVSKYAEKYFKVRNYLQKTRLGLTPIEGLADITGMGAMKKVLDNDFGSYLTYNDEAFNQWVELTKDFDESSFRKIGAYAISKQSGGADRLIANNKMTQEQIDNLSLTAEEMKAYNFVREKFDAEFPAVRKYALDNYNRDVGEIDNYVSFMSDNDALNELEMYDRFGNGPEGVRNTKTVEQGYTKSRAEMAENPLELDINKIFTRHMDDVAYMLTMGKDVKQYFEIVNSPEMREKLGDVGATAWLQYLDLMARKGGSEGAKRIAIIDTLRKNLAAGVLSFRISSTLVQLTSFADTIGTLGAEWATKGASSIATSKEWRNFVMDNFPEIRKAVGDDIAFREFGEGFLQKMTKVGFKPLQALDGIMRSTAAAGAYAKEMAARGLEVDLTKPNKEAIQAATRQVRLSQGSSFFKDQPLSLTTNYGLTDNKSLNKTILTFQSFMLARWDNMTRQIWRLGIKDKNYLKAFMSFFWMVIFSAAMEESIRRGSDYLIGKATEVITGEEHKNKRGTYQKNMAMNVLQSVPIMGSLASSMEYSSNPVPLINSFEQALSGASSVWNGKEFSTKLKGGLSFAGAAGSLAGIPGASQAAQLVKGFVPPVPKKSKSGIIPELPKLPQLPKLPKLK